MVTCTREKHRLLTCEVHISLIDIWVKLVTDTSVLHMKPTDCSLKRAVLTINLSGYKDEYFISIVIRWKLLTMDIPRIFNFVFSIISLMQLTYVGGEFSRVILLWSLSYIYIYIYSCVLSIQVRIIIFNMKGLVN